MYKHIFLLTIFTSLLGCGGGGSGSTGGSTSGGGNKPDLVITSFTADTTATAGTSVSVNLTLKNNGDASAGDPANTIAVGIYLSEDNEINPLVDFFVGWKDPTGFSGLSAGATITDSFSITLPTKIGTGSYYIGAYADPRHPAKPYITHNLPTAPDFYVYESDESNNSLVSATKIEITGSGTCSDDVYEDDDSSGHLLTLSVSENHNFCNDQRDYYQFDATSGLSYKITVTGSLNKHISLRVAGSETILDTVNSSSSTISLLWTADKTQTYEIEVSSDAIRKGNLIKDSMGLNTDYTMIIE